MLDLDEDKKYEKTKDSEKHSRAVEYNPHTGRKTEKVSGKHSGAGKRVYGVRGRACKPENAERVSEESEEYHSTKRYTRFIESSLGIKSYSELAPYLVEQMIELNKARNEEIKGFFKWLEREIGAEIDPLTNKTAIKEYHDNDFNHLLDVLKKNKNKISVDPTNRKIQESLEKHFNESISVLQPLKAKIKATDNLIDQIVYKLYNLTQDEIEIVEGKR